MSKIGGLRIKNLSELVDLDKKPIDVILTANHETSECHASGTIVKDATSVGSEVEFVATTTPAKTKKTKRAGTTLKESQAQKKSNKTENSTEATTVTPTKKISKTAKKQLPPDQTKIDKFFKSCSKTYTIEKPAPSIECTKEEKKSHQKMSSKKKTTATRKRTTSATPRKRGKGRKRLFEDETSDTTETTTSMSYFMEIIPPKTNRKRKSPVKSVQTRQKKQMKKPMQEVAACIDLCSESEEDLGIIYKAESDNDLNIPVEQISSEPPKTNAESPTCTKEEKLETSAEKQVQPPMVSIHLHANMHLKIPSPPTSTSDDTSAEHFQTTAGPVKTGEAEGHQSTIIDVDSFENGHAKEWNGPRRKVRTCPPYKIITGTTFAVDGFQFGPIKAVTHYFLSHFHADHYIGLTRKFSMPLFLSGITARLLRIFIPIDEKFLRIMELNDPQVIDGIEVTAIDANHCPGAIMFIFKLPTGKCILHTGDFRASPIMESEPVFWNNDIDIIYLDTTYISNKYAFCTQDESIFEAQSLIEQFQQKHEGKKILYICGAYLIGKEKFWSTIARKNKFSVWTDPKRAKALHAIADLNINELLNMNPKLADMHVITMMKLSYFSLVEYFEPYSSVFDVCLAIRPSGWEKNSKPQYRGKINIIGIEYSEHSSYNEMRRFVTYLKPKEVISTVPASGDLMITSQVPVGWYKYEKFPEQQRNWQPSITSYLKLQTRNEKNSENKITETCTPPQSYEQQENPASPKISPNKLSTKVGYDADDDWLS